MIIGVAIKLENGEVYSLPKPNRHWDLQVLMENKFGINKGREICNTAEYGFINSSGDFVDRMQAWIIANHRKQLLERNMYGMICACNDPKGRPLLSEDVW